MQSAEKASRANRCRALNKRGQACAATIVGPGGYCTAHDPERKVDMKAIGSKGGKSRRGLSGKLADSERASIVEALRAGLDRDLVVAAVGQSLTGGSESARVAAVRLLADLETYRRDGCPVCKAREESARAGHRGQAARAARP